MTGWMQTKAFARTLKREQQRITGKAGGIIRLFRSGNEAVAQRGQKPIFFNGDVFAVGDEEDLPDSRTPWREVSDREALEL